MIRLTVSVSSRGYKMYNIWRFHTISHTHLSSSEVWDADELGEGWGRRTRHRCQCWENWTSSGSWGCNHRSRRRWRRGERPWGCRTRPRSFERVPCLNVAEGTSRDPSKEIRFLLQFFLPSNLYVKWESFSNGWILGPLIMIVSPN